MILLFISFLFECLLPDTSVQKMTPLSPPQLFYSYPENIEELSFLSSTYIVCPVTQLQMKHFSYQINVNLPAFFVALSTPRFQRFQDQNDAREEKPQVNRKLRSKYTTSLSAWTGNRYNTRGTLI